MVVRDEIINSIPVLVIECKNANKDETIATRSWRYLSHPSSAWAHTDRKLCFPNRICVLRDPSTGWAMASRACKTWGPQAELGSQASAEGLFSPPADRTADLFRNA